MSKIGESIAGKILDSVGAICSIIEKADSKLNPKLDAKEIEHLITQTDKTSHAVEELEKSSRVGDEE